MRSKEPLMILAILALLAAVPAQATIVAQGSAPFMDGDGFFLGTKTYTVYTADDPGNPMPGAAGTFTYVYTVANDPGSFVGLIGFNLEVKEGSTTPAGIGWIDTAGNPTPIGVTLDAASAVPGFDTVRWDWSAADQIAPGTLSDQLYVISAYSPGTVNDNIYSVEGDFASAETSFCLGPFTPPDVTGEPLPCTIGFWKNRADGKSGTLQFFPDGDFDDVIAAAVALSGGVFTSGSGANCDVVGFADLLCALGSKGNRTTEERGRQQLAATLLNLAAGDLFPDNTKCKLFEGNDVTANECGTSISVGAAVSQSLSDIAGANAARAQACADDLNNGIGVVQ